MGWREKLRELIDGDEPDETGEISEIEDGVADAVDGDEGDGIGEADLDDEGDGEGDEGAADELGGDGDGDGDGGDGDCAEDMTVSAGLTPDITWEGGPAAGLAVAEYPEGANRQWVLAMAAATGFDSPVTYGTVPANALEAEGAAQDLVAGTEYSVTVTLSNGVDIRCQLFTP